MREKATKKASSKPLTEAQRQELTVLAARPDDQIDTRGIPEQKDWSGARRGAFFRPVKQQLTLRLDADLIAWFKARAAQGEGYQTRINSALRTYVVEHDRYRRDQRSPAATGHRRDISLQ